MRWWVFACALLVSGCLHDNLVACGNEVCPESAVCTPGGCASAEAATACVGLDEAAPCTLNGAAGFCIGGACKESRCGDGFVDPSEVCDDGNQIFGDDCSGDCKSLEICGNGITDPLGGEFCDDANLVSGDGCASTCSLEVLNWRNVAHIEPPSLDDSAMVLGPNGRLVLFGGSDSNTGADQADTWEWDGDSWLFRTMGPAPSARSSHAMAYDSYRKRVVLFGGFGLNAAAAGETFADTWEWDGVLWHQMTPATSPPKRADFAMAYDSIRKRVVLYGGAAGGVFYHDTWEWDGTDWVERPITGPGDRVYHSMAELPGTGVVLYGSGGNVDTWTLPSSGGTWVQYTGAGADLRIYSEMAFDPSRNTLVITGGYTANQMTWEWNGSSWASHGSGGTGRLQHVMAYDPIKGKMIVFGGSPSSTPLQSVNVATAVYTDIVALRGPANFNKTAYDSNRGITVAYDGNDTWEWDGVAWSRRAIGTPTPRTRSALAYDAKNKVVVLFGGISGVNRRNDTWTWNGTGWSQKTITSPPQTRSGHAMVYDSVRERVVMFGGRPQAGPTIDDTWEWDGTTWANVTPTPRPPAREGHGMAFDPLRGVTVMLGGNTANLADVWEWDGVTWTEKVSTIAHRDDPAMAYDPRLRAVVVFGGSRGPSFNYDDQYAWSGGPSWITLVPLTRAPAASNLSLCVDRFGTLVMGGAGESVTMRLAYESAATKTESCIASDVDDDGDGLAGCADPDCWSRCAPLCPPGVTCDPTAQKCGDGNCDSPLEDPLICPADC